MPSIKYMGYSVRHIRKNKGKNEYYEYHTWKPFNDVIKECRKLFPGTIGNFPIKDHKLTKTLFNKGSYDQLLFKNGIPLKDKNLETYYENIIKNKFMKYN